MFCSRRSGAIAILACLAAAGCARRNTPAGPPRLAILRFENLSGDPALDWMGRAFPEVIDADLSRARDITIVSTLRIHSLDGALGPRPVADPGISSERQAAIVAGAHRVGYGTYTVEGGRLRARLTIEDVDRRRMVQVLTSESRPPDVIPAAAGLAAALSRQTTAYPTRHDDALRSYAQAMETGDVARSAALLEAAIAADPDYGAPYRLLAQLEAQRQDRAGATATLERGLARGNAVAPVERARLAADLAALQNQPELRLRALAALVKLDPGDTGAWQGLATLAMGRRQFRQSVEAYRELLAREPEDFNSWNGLAYAAAYAGDIATATDAARHYAALRPNEVNPIDTLGDVNLMCGRFKEAEEAYLRVCARDPRFYKDTNGEFFKAAMARLWTGDIAGATTLAERYYQARAAAHDPLAELRKVEWTWLTGQRREACRQMEALARGSLSDVAPRAWAELAIWDLMLGDQRGAQAAGEGLAQVAPNHAMAQVIRYLLSPPASAVEWSARAAEAFPAPQQSGLRGVALTAALLLANDFQGAAQLLGRGVEAGPPQLDETAPVLLAWSYLETGRVAEAEPLIATTPVPPFTGADAFLGFSFPRLSYLRGVVAAKRGKGSEARADFRLFLQLSGPDALKWGEEAKARAGM